MANRTAAFYLFSALLLAGCVTKNDAGIALHKKPDLSKVSTGTPVKKVAGLKKPIKKEVLTKGQFRGAEAWLFEWDLPNDEVNNKMFTSVVVKDGVILAYAEESVDKWSKDPQLYKAAKFQSNLEDYHGYMAQAAQYGAAAAAFRSMTESQRASANQTRYEQMQVAQARDMMLASIRPPWENARPSRSPSYSRLQPDYIGGFRGNDGTQLTPDYIGGFRSSDGENFAPDFIGGFRGNRGTQLTPDLIGGYRASRRESVGFQPPF